MPQDFTRTWRSVPRRGGGAPLERIEEALAQAPLFAGLPKRHLRAVARVARVSTHPAGSTIVEQGSEGSALYVLVEGEAKVARGGRTLARLRPGGFFGEISVLDPGPRSASVVAETAARCVKLEGSDLRKVVLRDPKVALRLMTELARRVRGTKPELVG